MGVGFLWIGRSDITSIKCQGSKISIHIAKAFDIPDNVIISFQEHCDEKKKLQKSYCCLIDNTI